MRFASALAVSILAATGAAAQAPRVYYYCDTWGTYYPWVRTCPVPWRAVNAMPASPPPDTAAPSPAGAAERPAAPAQTKPARAAPSAARPAAANAAQFAQGLRDRTAWEDWFNGLSGDEQAGASFWAAERSRPNPGDCLGTAAFVQGCQEAEAKLAGADLLRKTEPQYRAGWNSYVQPAPPAAPAQATAAAPPPGGSPLMWLGALIARWHRSTCSLRAKLTVSSTE